MRTTIASLAALCSVWVFTSGFGLSGGGSIPVEESATAPADTTVRWINSDNGSVYQYHSWAGVWLDEGEWHEFSINAEAHAGPLRMTNNVTVDTTRTQSDGYWHSDSLMVTAYTFSSDPVVTNDCNVELFEVIPSVSVKTILDVAWGAGVKVGTKQTTLLGPGKMAAHIKVSPATGPNRPIVRFKFHKFARKT